MAFNIQRSIYGIKASQAKRNLHQEDEEQKIY